MCILPSLFLLLLLLFFFLYRLTQAFVVQQKLSPKDVNFVGYTYKNFEIVNEHHLSGISMYLLIFIQSNNSVRNEHGAVPVSSISIRLIFKSKFRSSIMICMVLLVCFT